MAKRSTKRASNARRKIGSDTRLRILHAADHVFAEHGYQAATMARIAARARVAPQTLYFFFKNKPLLLRALIAQAVAGFEEPKRPEDADWFIGILASGDGASALRALAAGGTAILQRSATAIETARLAAPVDRDVAKVIREAERLRVERFTEVAEALASRGLLAQTLTVKRARDILLTLIDAHPYTDLTRRKGWSDTEWTEWLGHALCRLLLP